LALNRALHPDYEIRYVRGSDDDASAFAPLAASDWIALNEQYGSAAVDTAFARLDANRNLFAGSNEK
jgi:hypothetical protein